MKRTETAIPGVCLLAPHVLEDSRGWFFEAYREDRLRELGIADRFVQDNRSFSRKGVLRGLHYQRARGQAKLVQVLQGEVFDVAVDVRPGSATFGRWVGQRLSGTNRMQMYIPQGFAHGFLILSDSAEVQYKCSEYYAPEEERGIAWNDPALAIPWPLADVGPILTSRDASQPRLADVPPHDLPPPQ